MLRFLCKKIRLCILIIAIFAILKLSLPNIGKQIGAWISGAEDSRIAEAWSEMINSFSDGGVRKAVEVFYDGLQEN